MMKKRRPHDVRRAFDYFQEAIRLEPGYLEPYHGAAMYYIVSAGFGSLPPRSALPQAEDLIAKGLALDANSVMLHDILGIVRMYQWRWADSEHAHRRAMNLEPDNAFPHMMYPILCSFLGRHDEAVLHAAKAVELDPLDLMTNFRLVQANYYARRYDDAVRTGRIAIELTPDSPYTYFYLALSLVAVGLKDEAWAMANTARMLNDGLPLGEGYFGYIAGVLGYTFEARSVVAALEGRREEGYCAAIPIAWTISAWVERRTSCAGWTQLWLNAIRFWDQLTYSPATTRSAIKPGSGDWYTNSNFRPRKIQSTNTVPPDVLTPLLARIRPLTPVRVRVVGKPET